MGVVPCTRRTVRTVDSEGGQDHRNRRKARQPKPRSRKTPPIPNSPGLTRRVRVELKSRSSRVESDEYVMSSATAIHKFAIREFRSRRAGARMKKIDQV